MGSAKTMPYRYARLARDNRRQVLRTSHFSTFASASSSGFASGVEFLHIMAASFRFLARSAFTTNRLNTRTPTATLRFCPLPETCLAPHRGGLRFMQSSAATSAEQTPVQQDPTKEPPPHEKALNDPNWRHPRFGFAAADIPHLIYVKLPGGATEKDVQALIARAGLQKSVNGDGERPTIC